MSRNSASTTSLPLDHVAYAATHALQLFNEAVNTESTIEKTLTYHMGFRSLSDLSGSDLHWDEEVSKSLDDLNRRNNQIRREEDWAREYFLKLDKTGSVPTTEQLGDPMWCATWKQTNDTFTCEEQDRVLTILQKGAEWLEEAALVIPRAEKEAELIRDRLSTLARGGPRASSRRDDGWEHNPDNVD